MGNDNGNQEKYHGERSQDRRRSRRNYGGEGKGEEKKVRQGEVRNSGNVRGREQRKDIGEMEEWESIG